MPEWLLLCNMQTNLCMHGSRVKWRSGHDMDDAAGLPNFLHWLTSFRTLFVINQMYKCVYMLLCTFEFFYINTDSPPLMAIIYIILLLYKKQD